MQDTNSRLDEERRRSDRLLYQMLPPEVASCLKNEERAPAQEHPEVSGWLRTHIDWDGVDARVTATAMVGGPHPAGTCHAGAQCGCKVAVIMQGANTAARNSKRVARVARPRRPRCCLAT